jgi:NAD(P)-dependent dehydrogenase (short-subunit alcohol dehydrogenase family)
VTETTNRILTCAGHAGREDRFGGAVALVTGSSRGIGRAISLALAEAGAAVALAARSADEIAAAASEIVGAGGAALPFTADVTADGAVEHLVTSVEEELGPLQILVNAAGVSPTCTSAERISREDYDLIMATNATAPFRLSQAVAIRMLKRRSGSITNIASVGGIVALPKLAAYCAAKAAVISFTRSMALDWADRGVRVNAVAPAYVPTRLANALISHPEIGPQLLARTPMHRFGIPTRSPPPSSSWLRVTRRTSRGRRSRSTAVGRSTDTHGGRR